MRSRPAIRVPGDCTYKHLVKESKITIVLLGKLHLNTKLRTPGSPLGQLYKTKKKRKLWWVALHYRGSFIKWVSVRSYRLLYSYIQYKLLNLRLCLICICINMIYIIYLRKTFSYFLSFLQNTTFFIILTAKIAWYRETTTYTTIFRTNNEKINLRYFMTVAQFSSIFWCRLCQF